jgi:hypothetical protein
MAIMGTRCILYILRVLCSSLRHEIHSKCPEIYQVSNTTLVHGAKIKNLPGDASIIL